MQCPQKVRHIMGAFLQVENSSKLYDLHSLSVFSLKLFVTTDTELRAIAAPAIIGSNKKPLYQYIAPAANGIPIKL